MVQYVLTPWRDRKELLLVRQQFYAGVNDGTDGAPLWPGGAGDGGASHDRGSRSRRLHQAVARVSMWMQRGNCPHMVESTALLTAAVLGDEEAGGEGDGRAASLAYAARAAYAAAFSRFVTGLLDGHQDKQRKQSMYALAKTIGLPATFVELRHQATHEQLPSLAKLRSAARKALRWIWEYYWRHLGPPAAVPEGSARQGDACEMMLLRYLNEEQDDRRTGLRELTRAWDQEELLGALSLLRERLPGNQARLKCIRLSNELTGKESEEHDGDSDGDMAEPEEEGEPRAPADVASRPELELEPDTGWSVYQGPWKPKPIGIV